MLCYVMISDELKEDDVGDMCGKRIWETITKKFTENLKGKESKIWETCNVEYYKNES
jgi:hypothetical protein